MLASVAMPAQARTPTTRRQLARPPAVPVTASAVEWVRMPRDWPAVLVATWAVEVTAWVLAPLPWEPAVLGMAWGMMALVV